MGRQLPENSFEEEISCIERVVYNQGSEKKGKQLEAKIQMNKKEDTVSRGRRK